MLRVMICLTIVLSAASSVRGDLPLPPNRKYIDPIVRFEGVAKLSEYTFRLRFTTFTGGPTGDYRYLPVPDGKPFNLHASRRLADMQLLALKRDEFERREKEDSTLRWLTDETPNVLAADVPIPSTTGPINEPVPVTSYRVSLRDGRLTVDRLPAEKKVSVAPPRSTWIAGIALSLAVTALGYRAFHRRPRSSTP